MAIDTPATIAILGAGPIGLEAALYSRFLGYSVIIYEQGEIADHQRQLSHLRHFESFGDSSSNLGLAAIGAHDEKYQPPSTDERLTYGEWRTRYLLPLSETDLLADCLRLQTRVLGVTKGELLKGDLAGNPDRGDWPFRILSITSAGEESVVEVDAVFDCTGVFGQPNEIGEGGLPALGERACSDRICRHVPDILGTERNRFVGKHVVIIGSGHSAATSVVALAELAKADPATRTTWITRRERAMTPEGPVARIESDPLFARHQLVVEGNQLALQSDVNWLSGTWVEAITIHGQSLELKTSGETATTLKCDEVIANVGYRPNLSLHTELQIDLNSANEAAPQNLLTGEPNYYILGVKSFGRRPGFRFRDGLNQIRELFKLIGDRPTLDLYASAVKLS